MRLALVAPLVSPIAPPHLGGAQVLLADLGQMLARRGHAVTLLAAAGSRLPGVRLVEFAVDPAVRPTDFAAGEVAADRAFYAGGEALLAACRWLARHATQFDLVHAHAYDWPLYAFAELLPLPVLHTVHMPAILPSVTDLFTAIWRGERHARFNTVSHGCAATYPAPIRFDAVILNGIAVDAVPVSASAGDRYLFAGRVTPEKGLADAIAVARRLGRPLDVVGGIYDRAYYERVLAPHLGEPWLRYHGALDRPALFALMARAAALLLPVRWDEPFGLVAAEAMAAGTPVVAYARGGLPEVVADGETGYVVPPDDLDALTDAAARAPHLDRAACRQHVAARFTLDRMVDDYERLYRSILAGPAGYGPLTARETSTGTL